MPREPKAWLELYEIEKEAETLLQRIAEEESKPIPSPELKELRKEYSEIKRHAEVIKEHRLLTITEYQFEEQTRFRAMLEYETRLSIMRSRRAWQDRMEQAIRDRTREAFPWDLYRKYRWTAGWRGRRALLGSFVRVHAKGFKDVASMKLAKVIQEFRILGAKWK